MVDMGYKREEVERSLNIRAYDDPFATYLLLGTKSSEVFPACFDFVVCFLVSDHRTNANAKFCNFGFSFWLYCKAPLRLQKIGFEILIQ